jgi:hypothetical protein
VTGSSAEFLAVIERNSTVFNCMCFLGRVESRVGWVWTDMR